MDVLLIANRTLASRRVFERVVWLRDESASLHVHVVVPVTPSEDAPIRSHDVFGRPVVDYLAIDAANARLRAAMSTIGELGVTVTGELGPPDPLAALRVALPERDYGRVVLATLPPGRSRWLRLDLVHRAGRLTDLPIDHVIGDEESEAATTPTTWHEVGVAGAKGELDILLVDDSEADLELATVAIEHSPVDAAVRTAPDGQEALNMAKERAPDLVLLDLSMPKLSGFETLELLHADEGLRDVPVVILTTSDRDVDRERAHALGAAAYIVKEDDFSRFEAVLQGLLAEVAVK